MCACVLMAGAADAATVYVYAFLGRQLTVVNAIGIDNAPMDRKQRTVIPLGNDAIDADVAADVEKVVTTLSPPYAYARITSARDNDTDPRYDTLATLTINGWFERLAPSVRFQAGDRLVLVVPAQGDIRFTTFSGTAGAGREAGMGIYVEPLIDQSEPVESRTHGMLGLFVNYRVLVIDPVTRRFIAEKVVNRGVARSGRNAPGGVPWAAVPDKEKFVILRAVVRAGLQETLPELLR
jgi:hypothetical protein